MHMNQDETIILKNQAIINRQYSMTHYGELLLLIYQKVLKSTVTQCIDKKALFHAFLGLNDFSLLKWT